MAKKLHIQAFVSMVSAFVMFIGGMAIAIYYPGNMSGTMRWLIALIVIFYFLARMGQSILVIRRHNLENKETFREVLHDDRQESNGSKTA